MELIDAMIFQVSQFLSNVLMPKTLVPEKHSKWYTVDQIKYPKYPRKSHYPFLSYEEELLKERSQRMLKQLLWNNVNISDHIIMMLVFTKVWIIHLIMW